MLLYIGPIFGAGTIATIIGFILSFFLAIIALFWVPIKKFIRYIQNKKKAK